MTKYHILNLRMKRKPTAEDSEIIDLCIRVLENRHLGNKQPPYARECAAIELGRIDTERSSVALGEAWGTEEDERVRNAILLSLRSHRNEMAQRLLETMEEETDRVRGRIRLKLAGHDS